MVSILENISSVYSTAIGVAAGDIQQYPNMVGIPDDFFRQPTPKPQGQIGFTATDDTLRSRALKVLAGTEPAAVSIPSFKRPMNTQTTSPVKVEAGIFGAFAGYQGANLDWSPIDLITTNSMSRMGAVGSGGAVQSMGQLHKGRENMDGLLFGVADIGNRMIPDAAQTFDNFAGGLLRAIKGRPTRYIDWMKGFDRREELIPLKTSWVEMAMPWMYEASDITTMPWNRTAMGQGWNAFALGAQTRIGATVPTTRGMLFASVV